MSYTKYAFLMFALVGASQASAATYYVKSVAPGGVGTSWNKAFNNLDAALNAASQNPGFDQIWVSAGTYKPSLPFGSGNLATFTLPSNVAIYGGFSGNETSLSQRNVASNQTVLSGDLGENDINDPNNTLNFKTDNAWHVLTADGVVGLTLDGLTVRGGYARGPDKGTVSSDRQFNVLAIEDIHSAGGGLLARRGAAVTLNNVTFQYNGADKANATIVGPAALGLPALVSGGGAIASVDKDTLVTIRNSRFEYNTANGFGSNGGALKATLESSLNISGSSFSNNVADRAGGAIHAKNAENIEIRTSSFQNNVVVGRAIGDESGGAISVLNTNLYVSSSSFINNVAAPAGGGAIFFQQPFDDGEPYTLSVDTSFFQNNQSGSIGGGAINIFGTLAHPGSVASISNSIFNNNSAAMGGAVYVDTIPTQIYNSVFTNNKAWVNGGAVFGSNFGDAIFGVSDIQDRTVLNISRSAFTGNTIVGTPAAAAPPVFVFNLFAFFQSSVANNLPLAGVSALSPGGGAIASELGGNITINTSAFIGNTAPNARGGAILVGGSDGCSGGSCTPGAPQLLMDQAYASLKNSLCFANSDATGSNNTAVLDPAGLGDDTPNGVKLDSDGSCR